jgi:hypothetical protein
MLAESEIKSMSATERLQATELPWRSFSGLEDEVPSPDWHAEVLSERLAKVEAGEGKFLSLSELKTRLALIQA